jgi:hypothetical protein
LASDRGHFLGLRVTDEGRGWIDGGREVVERMGKRVVGRL